MNNKFLKMAFAGLALTVSGFAGAALIGSAGPNSFGYEGIDIAYDLRDVRGSGLEILNGQDDDTSLVSIGFDFDFYGTVYDSIYLGSNGTASFASSLSYCCTSSPFGGGVQTGLDIAMAWTDSDLSENGNAYYDTLGLAGSRQFVFGLYNLGHNSDDSESEKVANIFELILHEGTNNIELQYQTLVQHADRYGSERISIGIQNVDGTDALPVAFYAQGLTIDTERLSNQGYLIGTSVTEVPEPSTLAILALGLMGLASRRFKKKS
jgi:hypothetical protein